MDFSSMHDSCRRPSWRCLGAGATRRSSPQRSREGEQSPPPQVDTVRQLSGKSVTPVEPVCAIQAVKWGDQVGDQVGASKWYLTVECRVSRRAGEGVERVAFHLPMACTWKGTAGTWVAFCRDSKDWKSRPVLHFPNNVNLIVNTSSMTGFESVGWVNPCPSRMRKAFWPCFALTKAP